MAAFSYYGNARVQWGRGLADTEHQIEWDGESRLKVAPLPHRLPGNVAPEHAYVPYDGTMDDHPAAHIVFLHA